MGILNFILGEPRRVEIFNTRLFKVEGAPEPNKATVACLSIDATIEETHSSVARPTEHPIESGSFVSDHVQIVPDELTIEGVHSNTPISFESQIAGLVTSGLIALSAKAAGQLGTVGRDSNVIRGAASGLLGGVIAGTVGGLLGLENNDERPKTAFEFLRAAQKAVSPLRIVTGFKEYSDMVLTDLTVPRRLEIGDAIRFTAVFKQIQLVKSGIAFVPEVAIDVDANGSGKVKEGRKSAGATDDETFGGLFDNELTAAMVIRGSKNFLKAIFAESPGVF